MDEETGGEPSLAEERRRAELLAAFNRRRRKRRWIAGLSAVAVAAVVTTGSAVAWSAQGSADALASRIHEWHVDRDRAECELAVRVVDAVALEQRTEDVLLAAEHIPSAETLLGERERAWFAEQRESLLAALAGDDFISDDDRDLARHWQNRASATADPAAFDLLSACLEEAAEARPPLLDAAPERVPELEQQLRTLGDPRDVDDARIDRLEEALEQLERTVVAVAQSRADVGALQSGFALAPEQALVPVRDADARIEELLAVVTGDHEPADVLDLVEALALHVVAGWMAESWQLEAAGERDAAAARAAAAEASRLALAEAAARPVADRAPSRPPATTPPSTPPPTVPVEPPPTTPDPGPTQPETPDPSPSVPAPVDPTPPVPLPPIDPTPIDPGQPVPPTDPGPPSTDPGVDPPPDSGQ